MNSRDALDKAYMRLMRESPRELGGWLVERTLAWESNLPMLLMHKDAIPKLCHVLLFLPKLRRRLVDNLLSQQKRGRRGSPGYHELTSRMILLLDKTFRSENRGMDKGRPVNQGTRPAGTYKRIAETINEWKLDTVTESGVRDFLNPRRKRKR